MSLIILSAWNGTFYVLLSMYLTTTSLIYLVQHYKGKKKKENFFVFLCSFNTFALSTSYLVVEFLSGGNKYSIKNNFLCVLIPFTYRSPIEVSKVLSSLIFVNRYERMNQRTTLAVSKRSKIFSAFIIFFSIVKVVGQVVYGVKSQTTSKLDGCFHGELYTNVVYSYLSGGCFLLKTILQTFIFVEIIKPMYKHCRKSTVANNNKVRDTLYRVVWCAIMMSAGDIGMVVTYFTAVRTNLMRESTLFIAYLFIDVLSLVCSYKDWRKRLFPFVSVFKNKENKKNCLPVKTITEEKAATSQGNSTTKASLQLLDES